MSKFDNINTIHQELFNKLSSSQPPNSEQVLNFINLALNSSPMIEFIDDRIDLNYILNYWASYYVTKNPEAEFLDIDIDSLDRRPSQYRFRIKEHKEDIFKIGSLKDVKKFSKIISKYDEDVSRIDFPKLLSGFISILPGAISDASMRQRRSIIDIIRDLSWSLEHNVILFQELIDEQAVASKKGLNELWINAAKILDLNASFYNKTLRRNLLDRVNHCYFLSDTTQFEKLHDKVKKDVKLGNEHLDRLSCIKVKGNAAKALYITDFALRNPRGLRTDGRVLLRIGRSSLFASISGERLVRATDLLTGIKDAVVASKNGKMNFDSISASLIKKGVLN